MKRHHDGIRLRTLPTASLSKLALGLCIGDVGIEAFKPGPRRERSSSETATGSIFAAGVFFFLAIKTL